MSMDVFKEAIRYARRTHKDVVFGGGEPTLHPELLAMIDYASSQIRTCFPILLITNGTCSTELWRELLKRNEENVLSLNVSDSPFHNRALQNDHIMRSAYIRGMRWWGDYTQFAEVDLVGRAKDNEAKMREHIRKINRRRTSRKRWRVGYSTVDECCDTVSIRPDGRVMKGTPPRDFGPLSSRAYKAAEKYCAR